MINNTEHLAVLQSPARRIQARVEHFKRSTLYKTYLYTDALKGLTINRTGLHKFFGYGIAQSADITLLDKDRVIEVEKGDYFTVSFGVNDNYITTLPLFYLTEVERDENTNELAIKAGDLITSTIATVAGLPITFPATVADYATLAAELMGTTCTITANPNFSLSYEEGANYEGKETLRSLLDDIAEVTQTIYYIDKDNTLVFKALSADTPALTITKADYFTLTSGEANTLTALCSATELGDNVTAGETAAGITQYIRDNPFIELREDVPTILNNGLSNIGGLTINTFNCDWKGNYLLEVGDYIALSAKDDTLIYSFLLDEKLIYNGGFSSVALWAFDDEGETASNPATLGDALNQTFARVDKVNKTVDIVVSDVDANKADIANLELTTGSISANVAELDAAVSATITSEDVAIEIRKELATNGVNKVVTHTGFTFDDVGLTISKSGTEMETAITEDGMAVKKNGTETLKADNTGVTAVNLHAKTYLIVGHNSRFEDYGSGRTGCFWIG